eukprot:761282-Hanusia_phi.AAC.2
MPVGVLVKVAKGWVPILGDEGHLELRDERVVGLKVGGGGRKPPKRWGGSISVGGVVYTWEQG